MTTAAPQPQDNYARLLALARYEILDTLPEDSFDRLVQLTRHILRTPAAYINFVDQSRQWTKACVGAERDSKPLSESMCAWTILQAAPLVVEDARLDPRFSHMELVTGEASLQMYAGVPLTTPSGHRIGTLCVTDNQCHPLDDEDIQALQDLAALVMTELELRAANQELQRDLQAASCQSEELRRTLAQAKTLEGVSALTDLQLPPEEMMLAAAALLSDAVASDLTSLLLFDGPVLRAQAAHTHSRLSPAQRRYLELAVAALPNLAAGFTWSVRDAAVPVYVNDYAAHPQAQAEMVAGGVTQVAWVPLGTRSGVTSGLMSVRLGDHPVARWRSGDCALLEAAGRTIRSALDRWLLTELASQQARQDVLTGALNRRAFEEDFPVRPVPFSLALLDLDGFKAINDREGHSQGDKVLRVFAETLNVELPGGASLYRVGGDEFVVLLNSDDVPLFDEQLDIALLAARQVVAGSVGVSLGMAHSHEAAGPALVQLADARMYALKERRRAQRDTQHQNSTRTL